MATIRSNLTAKCREDIERVLRCRRCGGIFHSDYDAHNHDEGRYVITPEDYGRRMAQKSLAEAFGKEGGAQR